MLLRCEGLKLAEIGSRLGVGRQQARVLVYHGARRLSWATRRTRFRWDLNPALTIPPGFDCAIEKGCYTPIIETEANMATTFTILRKLPTYKIARPFSRACNFDEAVEILQAFATRQGGGSSADVKLAMERAASLPQEHADALGLRWGNVNTDEPVLLLGRDKFYVFTEG